MATRNAPAGSGAVCTGVRRSEVRPSRTKSPLRRPRHKSKRTCSLSAALPGVQPGHHGANAAGKAIVEESNSSTALKRCKSGMAPGSAAITVCTAAPSNSSKNTAPASPSR